MGGVGGGTKNCFGRELELESCKGVYNLEDVSSYIKSNSNIRYYLANSYTFFFLEPPLLVKEKNNLKVDVAWRVVNKKRILCI